MIGKLPPQNVDAEESVLGACLLDAEAFDKALTILGPQDFYNITNRIIFESLIELGAKGQKPDTVLLTDNLRNKGKLEDIGGVSFVASLTDKVPSSANVEYYADIVFDKARRRRLLTSCMNIQASVYLEDDEQIFDKAESSILSACEEKGLKKLTPISEAIGPLIDKIEHYSKNPGMLTGITTGFKELDALTTGWHPGDLIIVAGRPGMGKTALCLDMARNAAKKGTQVAIYSLEMNTESLIKRILCAESGIDSGKMSRGTMSSYERALLSRHISPVSELPISIDDESTLTIQMLRSKARRAVKERNVGLIVVDYIQLMDVTQKTENRQQEITKISRGLKSIAKELNVPLLVASQLSRAVESRDKSKPRLSDLRESGSIEQDADAVLLIYRPDYYDKTGEDQTATIDIAKQRNGPTGDVKLFFKNDSTTFENLDQRSESV